MSKFSEFMFNYEESTLGAYSVSAFQAKLLFANPEKGELKDTVDSLHKRLTNPFVKYRYWIKEEIFDLHAILEAIHCKEKLEEKLKKTMSKKKSTQSNLDKLNQGKKTLTNFWKSQSTKANNITQYTMTITQCEQDIANYERMIRVIAANLYENAIPDFKKNKTKAYYKILNLISSEEQKNGEAQVDVWGKLTGEVSGEIV